MFDDHEEANNMRTGQKLDLETGNADGENIELHENAIYQIDSNEGIQKYQKRQKASKKSRIN